jgi:hypothetical protein
MPIKITKVFKGTNIIKAELANGKKVYGYRWMHDGKGYTRARWETKIEAETELSKFKMNASCHFLKPLRKSLS